MARYRRSDGDHVDMECTYAELERYLVLACCAGAARSNAFDHPAVRSSDKGRKLGQVCPKSSLSTEIIIINMEGWGMDAFHNSVFDPQTLVVLETAFDDAWLTLKSIGNKTAKPDELARAVLRLAMEGERDGVRLRDQALNGLLPATIWRETGR